MAKKANLGKLRSEAEVALTRAETRLQSLSSAIPAELRRWVTAMTAVEVHGIWERYAERRLAVALHHAPQHFVEVNELTPKTRVPLNLGALLVRGGRQYFDFRDINELRSKAKRLIAPNVFDEIDARTEKYLDVLMSARNLIVHGSTFSRRKYKERLSKVYKIKSAPEPEEFLSAIERGADAPGRGQPRVFGMIHIVRQAIEKTCKTTTATRKRSTPKPKRWEQTSWL